MFVLSQFLLRLSFGLATAMALTNPRHVTSGFFKTHLWVVLGLCTLALLVALATPGFCVWPPLAGAVLSYVGAVCWLYELRRAGRLILVIIAAVTLAGAWLLPTHTTQSLPEPAEMAKWLQRVDVPVSGLLLGFTTTAMFLGHWYLNTPTMQMAPLRRLLMLMGAAIVLRGVTASVGLWLQATETILFTGAGAGTNVLWVSLRWLWGILGAGGLAWMAWQTLKIPNTQSATGILYVAVIAVFLGELTAQLLSGGMVFLL